jgi:hypothetical protein
MTGLQWYMPNTVELSVIFSSKYNNISLIVWWLNNDVDCFEIFVWVLMSGVYRNESITNASPIQCHVTYIYSHHRIYIFFLFVPWDFGYYGHYWPIVPAPDDRWWRLWRSRWNVDLQGKPKFSEKICPSATFVYHKIQRENTRFNPGRRGGKLAANRLNYGAAFFNFLLNLCGGTLGIAATADLLYQPRMIGEGDCGEIGGKKIGRGNRSTRRKPALGPLFVHHKSHMPKPGFEPGPPRWETRD